MEKIECETGLTAKTDHVDHLEALEMYALNMIEYLYRVNVIDAKTNMHDDK